MTPFSKSCQKNRPHDTFKKVTVHYFDTEEYDPKQYSFEDIVPIEISGRQCSIDLTKI